MEVKKLVLGIHDLNAWGGQERSNLEIFRHLNSHFPIELHAYSFSDSRQWPQLTYIPYSQKWINPILLKINHYHAASTMRMRKYRSGRKQKGILLQSTGTALPMSDVVQVQFIHRAWHEIESKIELNNKPRTSFVQASYATAFQYCNSIHEQILYTPQKNYIAISHSVKKDLMRLFGIKNEKISVIYHGVNNSDFRSIQSPEAQTARREIRQKHNIPIDAPVLLSVGAINTRKGIHTALEVLKELHCNDFNDVILLAVGAGNTAPFIQQAEQLGLSSFIRLVTSQKDVSPYYQASDVFFFPTLYEPFGLVILEAMASGLPVVTTCIAGAAELITPGVDGSIITPTTSIKDIANEVSSLIKDKQKWLSISHRSQLSTKQWGWESVANQYLDFYKNL